MELTVMYENLPEEQRKEAAGELHEKILMNAQQVTLALYELCKSLKTMRDYKLYLDLGYQTFDEYVEEKTGFKARQAYTYIGTYEKLGKSFLQSNAGLGITKLSLLTEISAVDRQDFADEHDLAGMSVREMKELVEQNKGYAEQVSLLTRQVEQAGEEKTELERVRQELEEARREAEELRSRPVEVAVAEPSAEDINKIRDEVKKEMEARKREEVRKAVDKAEAKAKKDLEKAVSQAKEEARTESEKKLKSSLETLETEKAEAVARAAKLAKELEVSADGDVLTANFHFEAVKASFEKLVASIGKIKAGDPVKADKLAGGVKRLIAAMEARL